MQVRPDIQELETKINKEHYLRDMMPCSLLEFYRRFGATSSGAKSKPKLAEKQVKGSKYSLH